MEGFSLYDVYIFFFSICSSISVTYLTYHIYDTNDMIETPFSNYSSLGKGYKSTKFQSYSLTCFWAFTKTLKREKIKMAPKWRQPSGIWVSHKMWLRQSRGWFLRGFLSVFHHNKARKHCEVDNPSSYKWNTLEYDVKPQSNKQTNQNIL